MTLNPPPIASPAWTARTKRIVALICLLLVGLIFWRLTDILPIIVIAMVLSYLLNPITTWIDKNILSARNPETSHRSFAILLTFILLVIFLVLVILIVVPVLFEQLEEFVQRIPTLLGSFEEDVEAILNRPINIAGQVFVPMESLREVTGTPASDEIISLESLDIPAAVTGFIRSLTGPAFSFLGGAVNAIINFVFLLTLMFYLIKDGGQFVNNTVEVTPVMYRSDMRRLFYELAQVWDAYLRGQLILSLSMGGLVFIAASIFGVPNAPILGMLSALLEFIPTLGPALALIPAALLALSSQSSTLPFLEGPTFAIVVIVVWTLLQNIEAVILVPRVMGESLNLHPFVVMVGVLAGASVAGALGVILAAPVIASARVIGQYIYGKLTDKDPFPLSPPTVRERSQSHNTLGYRFAVALRYARMWLSRAWAFLQRRLGQRRGGRRAVK